MKKIILHEKSYIIFLYFFAVMKPLRLFKNKQEAGIFLVFLLLSAFYWFLNALENNYTTERQFPLTIFVSDSNTRCISHIPENITATIEGPGFDLFALSLPFNTPAIQLETQNLPVKKSTAKKTEYLLTQENWQEYIKKKLPASVKLISVAIDTLLIITDVEVKKQLPVKYNGTIQAAENFVIDNITLTPDSVSVQAPSSMLDTTQYIYTAEYVFNDIDENLSETLELQNPDEQFFDISPDEVLLQVQVSEYVAFTIEVPVTLPGNMHNIRLEQETVKVKGLAPGNKIDKLSATDFQVIPDLTNSENPEEISLKLQYRPEFAKNCIISPQKVWYNIER